MAFVMLEAIAQGESQGKNESLSLSLSLSIYIYIHVYIYLQNNTGFKVNGQCLLGKITCLCSFCTQICW